ncbi:hypothetical protein GDO78_017140 [Eleutherodactylus coqui]|uniref:Uncharacterized protein n=1 Tax=Eleutherodactylus coqui TaxID=57060 RepID=A0A8J6C821_ELECQ|nr:hypothetical protein GDO78_017140 [Eleutherodactylus coqui]
MEICPPASLIGSGVNKIRLDEISKSLHSYFFTFIYILHCLPTFWELGLSFTAASCRHLQRIIPIAHFTVALHGATNVQIVT